MQFGKKPMVVTGALASLTWDITEYWVELKIKFQKIK